MKKVVSFIVLFFLVFFLIACDPERYWISEEDLVNVIRVELINYNNPKSKSIEILDELLPFDFNLMEIIEVLPDDKMNAFLEDYSTAYYLEIFNYIDSANGKSLRLIYRNGDFKIVCFKTYYVCIFDSDGNVKKFCNYKLSYLITDIVNKHFYTKV